MVETITLIMNRQGTEEVKIIDLGSACFINDAIYTYIQSRFYRAPEVLLGLSYNCAIDLWSLGCIVAEMYLGIPIFPGNGEYDQIKRIIDIIGHPSNQTLDEGKFANRFYKKINGKYQFKTVEEYENVVFP